MFGKDPVYVHDTLGRVYAFTRRIHIHHDAHQMAFIPERVFARQALYRIAMNQEHDPFNHRLYDIWQLVFQKPWTRPRSIHDLVNDLADKIGRGELYAYIENTGYEQAKELLRRDEKVGSGGAGGGGGGADSASEAPRTQSGTTAQHPASSTVVAGSDSSGLKGGSVGGDGAGHATVAEGVPNKLNITQRLDELKLQGHGPQRHSGLTEQQLVDRVFDGIDPATGTRVDLVHDPKLHKKPSEATAFINDDAFVRAEHSVRNSQAFQEAVRLNPERPVVKISLQDALGNNGKSQVVGVKKIGPRENRQYENVDFSNGSVQAFYYYDAKTSSYTLETMFPTQYPVS